MDRSLVVSGVLALAAIGIGVMTWPTTPEPPPIQVLADSTDRTVTVHVSGAVARPGLVTVTDDARVADAIVAAGGATVHAELGVLNLAASVGDGSRIVVPTAGAGGSDVVGDGLVRLNTAGAEALEVLPGVGPVLAERIARHREDNGPYTVVEDLLDVPGIGESKLDALRDHVVVP